MGIVLLSVVVITGYAGQLSLGQFALAGFGALGRRPARRRAGLAVPAGAARRRRRHGPARRAVRAPRGARARHQPRHRHARPGHGHRADGVQQRPLRRRLRRHPDRPARRCSAGTSTPSPTPGRYAIVCMVAFALVALMVANMRRGRSGRRLARRAHQRAGRRRPRASASPAPRSTRSPSRPASPRSAACCWRSARTSSSTATSSPTSRRSSSSRWAFIGGIGYLLGPIFGSTLAPGSLGAPADERDLRRHHPVHPAHRRRARRSCWCCRTRTASPPSRSDAAHDPPAGQDDAAVAHPGVHARSSC